MNKFENRVSNFIKEKNELSKSLIDGIFEIVNKIESKQYEFIIVGKIHCECRNIDINTIGINDSRELVINNNLLMNNFVIDIDTLYCMYSELESMIKLHGNV